MFRVQPNNQSAVRTSENPGQGEFEQTARRICSNVFQTLRQGASPEPVIAGQGDPISIKDVEGRILLCNRAYNHTFVGSDSPAGRPATSFLAETVASVATHSDSLILGGCSFILFDHVGHDLGGRAIRFIRLKHSLLGLGHPTMAIIEVTRMVELLGECPEKPVRDLLDLWATFRQLDELDRNIAIGLAQGKSVSLIAQENGVTKKTIENHRSAIIRTLRFDSPIDLIKLVVRLQENGFGDYGV